ncbi:SEC-C metal-binding domain-containing protein [uncultured Lamprocystis sp.]|jgi:tetratricopeptide (TPR) repeat protein|uniref:SEC-C metal-binding domain-containing protein n=1 Tax=uncultured Lamprocystis sp. TaxID=543132 RepID=UPI0025E2976F|nr:SEC-C metal-binding domain-containing protein [uncultured Lamprocystis sp.]
MFHHETADTERFEQVILLAVRQIIQDPDPVRFLAWAKNEVPRILGLYDYGLEDVEIRRLTNMLATAIWNATPQPDLGYRAQPLEPPSPHAPCPCGSGERYDACCGDLDDVPELSAELIWELLLDELPERALKDALEVDAVPRPLLARVADRWLEQDRPGRAVALLEPVFAGPLAALDGAYEPAFDVLCDAYDRLDHWRKKQAFLERLCTGGSRALQAAAWQRISTIHIDEGDFEQARDAFAAALRSDPDNPSNALLEITLLAAQHQDDLASARARFWLHRLRKIGAQEQGFLDFLAQAVKNPQQALVDSHADALDPLLVDLQDWITTAADRPLPDYGVVPLKPPQRDAPARTRAGVGAASSPRRSLMVRGNPADLRAPARVRRLELVWRTLFPGGKPSATDLTLGDAGQVWLSVEWIEYLLATPEAADSLDILDDLATALYEHPESTLPWISHALLRPLVDRAWGILNQAAPAAAAYHCPWTRDANRPALRLLFRRYLCQIDEGQPQAAAVTLETLLRLNPQDHHGVRAELMNHYLRGGEDARALTLARRFPDDLLADLAYGEVLALYRLGEQERARAVLRTAVDRLPRIPRYLTRKRIKRPRPSPLGVTPGGEDQAWMYREAMRDVWEAEPGILRWMKRVTA